jgi:hypothetical protein
MKAGSVENKYRASFTYYVGIDKLLLIYVALMSHSMP